MSRNSLINCRRIFPLPVGPGAASNDLAKCRVDSVRFLGARRRIEIGLDQLLPSGLEATSPAALELSQGCLELFMAEPDKVAKNALKVAECPGALQGVTLPRCLLDLLFCERQQKFEDLGRWRLSAGPADSVCEHGQVTLLDSVEHIRAQADINAEVAAVVAGAVHFSGPFALSSSSASARARRVAAGIGSPLQGDDAGKGGSCEISS